MRRQELPGLTRDDSISISYRGAFKCRAGPKLKFASQEWRHDVEGGWIGWVGAGLENPLAFEPGGVCGCEGAGGVTTTHLHLRPRTERSAVRAMRRGGG